MLPADAILRKNTVSVLKTVLKRGRQQDDNEMMGYEPEGWRWY